MAQPIGRAFQGSEIHAFGKCDRLVRREARYHREGAQHLVPDAVDRAVAAHLKAGAIENDHLAVEVLEGAKAEIAMLAQRADPYGALIDALHQRRRAGDLKEGAVL